MKPFARYRARASTWATVAGVLIIAFVAFEIHTPTLQTPTSGAPAETVEIVDPVVLEGTALFDLTPLFLPTKFNSSRKDYVPFEPEGAFRGFAPKWVYSAQELTLRLANESAVPSNPAEALGDEPPGAPFLGFGRRDLVVEPVAPRTAYVEIVEAGSGRSVLSRAVADARPPASSWRPLEFIAAVDSAGLVGPPVLTVHSDAASVDGYFARYLADTLQIGQRLAPGIYRISVGP